MKSKTIAYVAVCSAVAIVCSAVASFTSIKSAPIALCALCFVLAFKKTGLQGGATAIVVTEIITAILGKVAVLLMSGIMCAPYAFLAYFMRKLKGKSGLILRAIIAFVFFFLSSFALIRLSLYTAQLGLVQIANEYGIWLVSFLFGLFCVPVDYMIDKITDMVIAKIK